ncbi:hypothetical protein ZEAMMB73_Zm00001d009994 [Zea mays]|uniref:Pectinesterase inhibitor domain-containing protein n=1 Tax=Zea mays TaxID=4577 RepID=A0A1D6FNH6_MAIZE|nr:hypothetical protein ZEAMMB73_Zm00001d009994 [Zea mays]
MGQAYPRLVLLALVALLSAGLFPQALGNGKGKVHGGGAVNPLVAGICSRAPFPEVCTATAGRHASKYPVIDKMYMNTQDAIGAAQRAIAFKDTGTAKIMLQLAVQDFDSCDRPFTHAGVPNPMGKFDKELSQMANNCMTLANMI